MASAHRPRLDPVASDLLTALPDSRAVWNRAAGPEVEVLPFVATMRARSSSPMPCTRRWT